MAAKAGAAKSGVGVRTDVVPSTPVTIIKGGDEVLVADVLRGVVDTLVANGDRSLMVEELDGSRYESSDGADLSVAVDAAQTPSFLTERRVVVARHLGPFSTKDSVQVLVDYLADPLETTSLVLVWERDPKRDAKVAAVPKSLVAAVGAAGGVVLDAGVGRSARDRDAWVDEHITDAGLKLARDAKQVLLERLGDDVNRLGGILEALRGTYGSDTTLHAADVEPYLGDAGDIAPWDLTDAIDKGDVPRAMDCLGRMMGAGARHPLQIIATLNTHVTRMLALDGAGVANEKQAAELLGMTGSTFPAKKALEQSRRLGSDRLAEFTGLLAQADLDLHGAKAWPPELVIEVLVARLASRSRRR